MRVIINGEERVFANPLNAADLLAELDLDPRKVALERNLEIVPRSAYATVQIADGDKLEIVHFIGGGGEPADFRAVFAQGKADAALAASIFHTGAHSPQSLKQQLAAAGLAVRTA